MAEWLRTRHFTAVGSSLARVICETSQVLLAVYLTQIKKNVELIYKPEDHWSCIAHLSAEDMLKSAVIEEKKLKRSPWTGADNSLGPKFLCQQEGLITMVICCKLKQNLFNL